MHPGLVSLCEGCQHASMHVRFRQRNLSLGTGIHILRAPSTSTMCGHMDSWTRLPGFTARQSRTMGACTSLEAPARTNSSSTMQNATRRPRTSGTEYSSFQRCATPAPSRAGITVGPVSFRLLLPPAPRIDALRSSTLILRGGAIKSLVLVTCRTTFWTSCCIRGGCREGGRQDRHASLASKSDTAITLPH